MSKTVHVELELVVHLWVDYDPSAPAEASVIAGQLRGVPLGVHTLAAIVAACEAEVLDEARIEAAHRDHPTLPMDTP